MPLADVVARNDRDRSRVRAARLQAKAEQCREPSTSESLHRIIRGGDYGWVEIHAEYLEHLLDRIASGNAEIVRQQELWALQSGIIKALAVEVPDDVRARVLAPLVEAYRG